MTLMIDVLLKLGPIDHFSYGPSRDPGYEDLSYPPHVWWTYKDPSEQTAAFIRQAIASFSGEIAWEFLTNGRRWTLMPARLGEYGKAHGIPGGLYAAAALKREDPEFGKRANADLQKLAEHIERQIHMGDV
jgi:hypothetical protein